MNTKKVTKSPLIFLDISAIMVKMISVQGGVTVYSYRSLKTRLMGAGIDSASAGDEAALLLQCFCGVSRAGCLCDRDRLYDSPALDAAVEQRLRRYPLQYILGKWDFYGISFAVNEHCLIPRPDTELLVEEAIRTLPQGAFFADLCTGSGCIAIAILVNRPDTKAVVLELFPETLALAQRNAEANGVADRMIFVCADLLNDGKQRLRDLAPLCAILSNPPYIPQRVVDELAPELFFEPRAALDGGEDGLIFYRAILKDYAELLSSEGQIMLEIGYDQAEALAALGRMQLPHMTYACKKDLGGQDRVVIFRHK